MKIKMILVIMLTLLLLAAGPLAAKDKEKKNTKDMETYRKAILLQAKVDIAKFREQLKGGLADGKAVTDFPLKQLLMGIEMTKIHTDNPMLALELAMDHLMKYKNDHARRGVMGHGRCGMMGKGMHHRGMMNRRGRRGHCCSLHNPNSVGHQWEKGKGAHQDCESEGHEKCPARKKINKSAQHGCVAEKSEKHQCADKQKTAAKKKK